MMHSEEFKKAAVQKILTRGNRTVMEIAEELGINQATIDQWRKHFAIRSDMKKNTKPQSRSVSEKLKAVAEYNALTSEKRGENLRKSGLYEDIIIEWQKQIEEAFSPKKKSRIDAQELFAEQKK